MLRLKVDKLLKEQARSKYWLAKETGIRYPNLDKIVKNKTKLIRYDTLEALSNALNCSIGDLFEKVKDPDNT